MLLAVVLVLPASMAEDRPVVWEPPADLPCTLRDIASRLPPNTPAKDDCPITYGHEGSHFLSKGKEGWHGIYMLDGRIRYLPTPPILTDAVFARVPPRRRGTIFDTYRRQGRDTYWQTQPLMLVDEWVAYLRGSQIRKELGWSKRAETNRHCATMAGYCEVLCDMAAEVPSYDVSVLKDFCREIANECRATIPEWDQLTDARFE